MVQLDFNLARGGGIIWTEQKFTPPPETRII
jgi:hypothetical protein